MGQWLGLLDLTAKGLRSTPGQGTKIPKAAQRLKKKEVGWVLESILNLIKMKICHTKICRMQLKTVLRGK